MTMFYYFYIEEIPVYLKKFSIQGTNFKYEKYSLNTWYMINRKSGKT